jgi:hypothetical protein
MHEELPRPMQSTRGGFGGRPFFLARRDVRGSLFRSVCAKANRAVPRIERNGCGAEPVKTALVL